jgi:CRISPR-associated endonuclease Csn1
LTEIKQREHKRNDWSEEVIKDWSKRLDHRHHAIDALVIACTKQGYIQRINNMSELKDVNFAPEEKQGGEYQERKTRLEKYLLSQPHFSTAEVEKAADSILVSFKAGKKAASTGKRYVHRGGKRILVQENIVIPRGALHEESVYGSIDRYAKNRKGETVVEKQSVLKYPLSSIVRKDIEFIVDEEIKKLIKQRFDNHAGNEKDVWKDLAGNPLLFKGVPVRSVRCFTGLKPEATAALDRGSVKLGNNHHIAIYTDRDGKRRESCVTFWHAVERMKYKLPAIITRPDQVWDRLPEGLPEQFVEQLPRPDWTFEVSLQQNEMFVLGLEPEAFEEALRNKDYALLSRYLYRVQSIGPNDYWFRLHIETINDKTKEGKEAKKFHRFKSVGAFFGASPQKVRISLLGEITKV